ncbi:Serine/threonine protein kinase [Phytophthora megakarya]|uniref:Serine/threonine protein kinase n=1 Tax=Phytophthora megakarya TaxID=4795 RepID=A0A225WLJ0_9STRA|nr:Serine/threonine protein kinase [Phytophthora megakarya]
MKPSIWKYLYDSVMGHKYIHERDIICGDLCYINPLIGSNSLAIDTQSSRHS